MRTYRVAKACPALLEQLSLVVDSHRQRPGPREALEGDLPVLPGQHVSGRQLADLAEDRERGGNGVGRQERLERVEVEVALRQRVELGGERELPVDVAVVERLDPEPVACEHEPLAARVPDRDREHPAQPLREPEIPLLVGVDDRLGVRARAQRVPGALQRVVQLRVVVDLTVLDDGARPSSFEIGWSPPATSMIASRREASPTPPLTNVPSASGPRWMSVSDMAASRLRSIRPRVVAIPQIPHTRPSLESGGVASAA